MVNHVRTLLMNENSSSIDRWYCDESFVPLNLSGELASFNSALFRGASGANAKADRVCALMPFATDPEFSDVYGVFDTRSTEDLESAGDTVFTVFDFYRNMSGTLDGIVSSCVSFNNVQSLFKWDDNDDEWYSSAMARLKRAFMMSKETSKRFSACLLAYLVRLEKLRLRSISRSPRSSSSPSSVESELE